MTIKRTTATTMPKTNSWKYGIELKIVKTLLSHADPVVGATGARKAFEMNSFKNT